MVYDFLGKKMTKKEVHNELLMNPKINLEHAYVFIGIQNKINAERRIQSETDPCRKRLMEEMYNHGLYDFDYHFGEE